MEKSRDTATVLLKTELSATQGREIRVVRAELTPNLTGRPQHHLVDKVVCLLEGSMTFTLEGKPDVTLKTGATCHIPATQSHFGTTSSESVKFLSIQVQETGGPSGRLRA